MVIVLLVIIIIILVPSLIGIAAGVAVWYLPIILIGLVGGTASFFLTKKLGVSDEAIMNERTKQAIDDKYTAFYVLCSYWKNGRITDNIYEQSPSFKVEGGLPYAAFSYFPRRINDVLDALKLPYISPQSTDDVRKSKRSLEEAYKQGKENFTKMKWYAGNGWNKVGNLLSGNDAPQIHLMAKELEKILNVKNRKQRSYNEPPYGNCPSLLHGERGKLYPTSFRYL